MIFTILQIPPPPIYILSGELSALIFIDFDKEGNKEYIENKFPE